MALLNTGLTTTAANVFASSGDNAITTIYFCNYSASPATVNVYVVPSGQSAGVSTIVYSNVSITAYNTLVIDTEKLIMATGDTIKANANATGTVTATVSSIGL